MHPESEEAMQCEERKRRRYHSTLLPCNLYGCDGLLALRDRGLTIDNNTHTEAWTCSDCGVVQRRSFRWEVE